MALLGLMVGARGPQLVKCATAWAFERHKDRLAACQQLVAARAPHIKILLFHNASKCCAPEEILLQCSIPARDTNIGGIFARNFSFRVEPWGSAWALSRWGRPNRPCHCQFAASYHRSEDAARKQREPCEQISACLKKTQMGHWRAFHCFSSSLLGRTRTSFESALPALRQPLQCFM